MDIVKLINILSESEIEYLKQILNTELKREHYSKTTINVWEEFNPNVSVRLLNILHKSDFIYIEDVTKKEFLKIRNSGISSWNEFVLLCNNSKNKFDFLK